MAKVGTKHSAALGRVRHHAHARVIDPIFESDSTYFLKLVLCVIFGTLWVKFASPFVWFGVPFYGIPMGLFAGLLITRRYEKDQQDRKIAYAILLLTALISYFLPLGIVI